MKPSQTIRYDVYRLPENDVKKAILEHYNLPLDAEVHFPSGYRLSQPVVTIKVNH